MFLEKAVFEQNNCFCEIGAHLWIFFDHVYSQTSSVYFFCDISALTHNPDDVSYKSFYIRHRVEKEEMYSCNEEKRIRVNRKIL